MRFSRKFIWIFLGSYGDIGWNIGKSNFDASLADRLDTLCGTVQTQNEGLSSTGNSGIQIMHRTEPRIEAMTKGGEHRTTSAEEELPVLPGKLVPSPENSPSVNTTNTSRCE